MCYMGKAPPTAGLPVSRPLGAAVTRANCRPLGVTRPMDRRASQKTSRPTSGICYGHIGTFSRPLYLLVYPQGGRSTMQ